MQAATTPQSNALPQSPRRVSWWRRIRVGRPRGSGSGTTRAAILRLLADGRTREDIARIMDIDVRTVRRHIARARRMGEIGPTRRKKER